MGLDITAYGSYEEVENPTVKELEDGRVISIGNDPLFDDRGDRLRDALYVRLPDASSISFRAGSCSTYNDWRWWLCLRALASSPVKVWHNPEEYADKPFYELIHFTDCDGFIGPDTCAKLYKDFCAHQIEGEDWHLSLYGKFKTAFDWAKDNGFVRFS